MGTELEKIQEAYENSVLSEKVNEEYKKFKMDITVRASTIHLEGVLPQVAAGETTIAIPLRAIEEALAKGKSKNVIMMIH